jgi:hypothetical protein
MAANKKYKDSVFTLLFSDKELLRKLANAFLGTSFDKNVKITINTLSKVLFWGRRNDISFLVEDKHIVLAEHQSTINRNMPLRFLFYISRLYEKLLKRQNKKLFQRTLLPLPKPEFIVLYNGKEEYQDRKTLKLSDAFDLASGEKPNLELEVKVFNINEGHNAEILEKCPVLTEYSQFVQATRRFDEKISKRNKKSTAEKHREEVLTKTVQWCIKNNILRDFLTEHSTEVTSMSLLNWTVEEELEERVEERMEEIFELLDQGLSRDEIKAQLARRVNA